MNLLTVREVADRLKISESTVYSWASQKKIPYVHLSRKAVRFREQDIEDIIDRRLVHPEAHLHHLKDQMPKPKKSNALGIPKSNDQVEKIIENAKVEVLRRVC